MENTGKHRRQTQQSHPHVPMYIVPFIVSLIVQAINPELLKSMNSLPLNGPKADISIDISFILFLHRFNKNKYKLPHFN